MLTTREAKLEARVRSVAPDETCADAPEEGRSKSLIARHTVIVLETGCSVLAALASPVFSS